MAPRLRSYLLYSLLALSALAVALLCKRTGYVRIPSLREGDEGSRRNLTAGSGDLFAIAREMYDMPEHCEGGHGEGERAWDRGEVYFLSHGESTFHPALQRSHRLLILPNLRSPPLYLSPPILRTTS